MTTQQAHERLKDGTDICLTLKYGYGSNGFATTTSIIYKACDWVGIPLENFVSRAKWYIDNAIDHVICEA
jgi:hypothetical protein